MTPTSFVPIPPHQARALERAAADLTSHSPVVNLPELPFAHEQSVDAIINAALTDLPAAAPDGTVTPETTVLIAAAFHDAATRAHCLAAEHGFRGERARDFVRLLAGGVGRLLDQDADAKGYGRRPSWDLAKAAFTAWHNRIAELRSADNLTRARAH